MELKGILFIRDKRVLFMEVDSCYKLGENFSKRINENNMISLLSPWNKVVSSIIKLLKKNTIKLLTLEGIYTYLNGYHFILLYHFK